MAPTNAELTKENERLKAQIGAAGGGSHNPPDEPSEVATARAEAIASRMDPRDHLRDCPIGDEDYDGAPNVEAYGAHAAPNKKKSLGERDVTVVRCLTCGGSVVVEETYEAFIAALDG